MTTLIVTLPSAPFDAATLYDHVLTVDAARWQSTRGHRRPVADGGMTEAASIPW